MIDEMIVVAVPVTPELSGFFLSDGTAIREPTAEELKAVAGQLIEEKRAKAQSELDAATDEPAKGKSNSALRGLARMTPELVLETAAARELMVKKWKRGVEQRVAQAKADEAVATALLFEDLIDEPAAAEPEPSAPVPEAPKDKTGGNGHIKAAAAALADESQTARVVALPPERGPIKMGHPLRAELAGVFPELVWLSAEWCAAMRYMILVYMHMKRMQAKLRDRANLTAEAISLYGERVRLLQGLLDKLERVYHAHGVMKKDQIRSMTAAESQRAEIIREIKKLPELAVLFNMPQPRSREEIEAERQALLEEAEAEEIKRQRRAARNRFIDELAERIMGKGGVSNKNSAKKMARNLVSRIPEDVDLGNFDVQKLLKEAAVDRQARHLQENSGDDRVNPSAEAYRKAAGGMSLTELDRGVRRKLGLPEPKPRNPGDAAAEQAKAEASATPVVDKAPEAQDVAPTEVVDSTVQADNLATEPAAEMVVEAVPVPEPSAEPVIEAPAAVDVVAPATDTAPVTGEVVPVADEPAKGKKVRPPKKGGKK